MSKSLLPATLGTSGLVDAFAIGLARRQANQSIQENHESAVAWRNYAMRLEDEIANLKATINRLHVNNKQWQAALEASKMTTEVFATEGHHCSNKAHHKLSSNPGLRNSVYDTALKMSYEKHGVPDPSKSKA